MVGSALVVLAVLLLGLVANILFVSQVLQARDQSVLYADLRLDLANATVPVGQLDSDGVLVEAGRPVAMLRIPSLGVEQVVVEGTTSGVLMTGPGHRRDTVMPGQAGVSVVFGRQAAYGGPFAAIGSLRTDDVVEVTTGQGEMTFRVTGVRRAGDPLPTALAAGESRLVLVSAEGQRFAPDGVVRVDTVLVGDPQPAGTRVITSPTQAETPMAGDPTSWLGVLLWSQLLLLVAVAATWSWIRWGRWQTWVIGLPVLAFVGLGLAGQLTGLLPNLI